MVEKGLKISETSVRRIVKTQLGYRSYKFSKAQVLTENMKENRLQNPRICWDNLQLDDIIQSFSLMKRSLLLRAATITKMTEYCCKKDCQRTRCFDHHSKPFSISCFGLGCGNSQWEDTIGVRWQERKDKCAILPTTDSKRCVGHARFWKLTMDASTRLGACTFSQNDNGSLWRAVSKRLR